MRPTCAAAVSAQPPRLLSVAIARLAEIPPQSHSPQLSSSSGRHPAADPSLGLFILHIFHRLHSVSAVGCRLCRERPWSGSRPLPECCVALPSTSKPACLQSRWELIPQAGADLTSFGARIQHRDAAVGWGCSLCCHGDLRVQGP